MRWRSQGIFLPLLVLLFLLVLLSLLVADPQTAWIRRVTAGSSFAGKVVGVSCGDTISVMRGGRALKVRLHRIDCPEKKQTFDTRAKRFTSDFAFGKEES